MTKITVAVSGGFDPLHVGHLWMIRDAKSLGDELIVILNNDNWLLKKKGYVFMPQEQRKEILESLRYVDKVIITDHSPDHIDTSVCAELRALMPDIFANGGDRKADNIPEYTLCESLGIQMRFNTGGEKASSSSELVRNAKTKAGQVKK